MIEFFPISIFKIILRASKIQGIYKIAQLGIYALISNSFSTKCECPLHNASFKSLNNSKIEIKEKKYLTKYRLYCTNFDKI